MSSATVLAASVVFLILLPPAAALVRVYGSSFSFTFVDAPAPFAVPINASGTCGSLHIADPLDACSTISKKSSSAGRSDPNTGDRFVLIKRGQCSFDRKVRVAQDAGFDAAIIFDDRNVPSLYSMIGNPIGIHIHAVFVSRSTGETLQKYADGVGECCMSPLIEESAGTMLVLSFISVVVIVSGVAMFVFVQNCSILPNAAHRRNSCMDRQEVEIIPQFTFKCAQLNNKCSIETCAICLEDYQDGQRIRLLPCRHDFHTACVDSWLTKWGTFCPICKFQLHG